MTEDVFTAPKPEVVHLPTLFRRVDSGEIRIPSFQRPFVWRQKQVIELLESVYRGYPVGSLLFWRTDAAALTYDSRDTFGRAISPTRSPVSFLLDGQQRLTSLYRCFFADAARPSEFNVCFDLARERFYHVGEDVQPSGTMVPLSALFQPKEFLAAQQRILSMPEGEALSDVAIRLHTRFQEYMVPAVTIEGRDVADVVEIFERINRTGTTLSAVDFMRAVTWSHGFDLRVEVEKLATQAEANGYVLEEETIVKLIAIALGRAPLPEEMLQLRGLPAADLHDAVARVGAATSNAIRFLRTEASLLSYEYVPYEGQFLAVARAFQVKRKPSKPALAELLRWFWSITFNEGLRGTPDHVVASLVRGVDDLVSGRRASLDTRLTLSEHDVLRRKFIRGKALSAGLASLFAKNGACSLVTGEVIDTELFMSSFDPIHYGSLVRRDDLPTGETSAKSLANIFLCTDSDRLALRGTSISAFLASVRWPAAEKRAVLQSQFVTPTGWGHLKAGRLQQFFGDRASAIVAAARALTTA